MFFLKISNADMLFGKKIFIWRFYTTNKAQSITKRMQIVNPKKFVIVAFNANSKRFVIYVAIREQEEIDRDLTKKAQIEV